MPVDPRQPVRVLHVMRPAVGGMRGHVLQLASGLASAGFECEIACPDDPGFASEATQRGVPVHVVPIVGPVRPFRDVRAVRALQAVMRTRRPALVHAHGFKAAMIARMAVGSRREGAVPVVVTIHNHVLYRDMSRFQRWRHVALERLLARRTARIITVSEELRHELVEEYGIDPAVVTTVHNGVDLAPFLASRDRGAARARYGITEEALVFGLAARFAPQKAMDVLVSAAEQLIGCYPQAYMLLAGDGPLLDEVRALAAASTARDRMLFPGFEGDMPTLLAALDVYVSAALSEGLPLGTIEAMAAGLPVVSTRVGGTPEVVQDGVTGLLVEPGDADALGTAMLELAGDPGKRGRFGVAGRARAVAGFTEERMIAQTAAVYREALE